MNCRYCDRPRIRGRSCSHRDVCAKCHDYLWCEGKPPRNQHARLLSALNTGRALLEESNTGTEPK